MFDGGRYIYAVFMCHLAIEKALKDLYMQKVQSQPPKTHNLWFLIEKTGLDIPADMSEFIDTLNRISIVTRYPDDLRNMTKVFEKTKTLSIMRHSEKVLQWLKQKQ